jgi:hypothetical protein
MLPPDPANASYRLPALADAEFGGIAHPALIRRLGRELAIEEIRGDRVIVIAHRCAAEALPDPRLQALLLHQTDDPLSTHPHLLLEQVPIDPRASVPMRTLLKRRAHLLTRRGHSGL